MRIVYSYHAKKRLKEREISEETVRDIIELPEYTIKRGEEIEAYKKVNSQMTKIVYVNKEKYIKVITLYPLK
ncbi:DUF4258 domain-containing protein [Candidatus Pacearchaeota archaeon]|nr:DUF4258 domain-containing protein [Candidatus Pacearchaeota archaeon]